MAKQPRTDELVSLLGDLRAERARHLEALARIDETFAQLGISPEGEATVPARGRKAGKKRVKRASKTKAAGGRGRSRGRFKQTGEESVLALVKRKGGATSAEVNAHWAAEGRRGKANNALTKLVQEGKLKRVAVKGQRGGVYKLA